jgi:hypothetical protein
MNNSDPRRSVYFDQNLGRSFKGGPYGENNSFHPHVSSIVTDPKSSILLDITEVNFYLADAAERSISGLLFQQSF